ncbi:TetR/AcrR family transcriptional regulator [Microbispora triticiradicis]|uniref:TetR/AcrR family transcriptional regulator n=1 Tax=Microbispora triticiradicis TaxID=2200763 RepID=UPI001AD6A799|nr:TetR/AcrR family transcriptional regulator [Microbispora triticiradicis]MBO4273664.1 TetR family transcriptional regulator [Microbispora triticiradicis]
MSSARRAPRERGQAAERTRERILRAAVEEFGAKGYAGARTASIAERAGVNQQLISYYFGGKQGLVEELRRRWTRAQESVTPPGATYAESVAAHLNATLDNPDWSRLMIWQALGDSPVGESDDEWAAAQRARLREAVERTRGRQEEGEITDELDAEFVLLVAYALTFAPIALPRVVEGIVGVDPLSKEYREWVVGQLAAMTRRRS